MLRSGPLSKLKVSTWNILGDQFNRTERLELVASSIDDIDIIGLQEVIIPKNVEIDYATRLAEITGMRVASLVPGGVSNNVSGDPQGTAILTKLKVIAPNIVIPIFNNNNDTFPDECSQYAGAILSSSSNRQILFVSCHLPWGATKEHRRLFHLQQIVSHVDTLMRELPGDSLAIIAGDFNTIPAGDAMRFMRGELGDFLDSTFWVDSWNEEENGPGFTFDPKISNRSLIRTAQYSGILKPELMPQRRLDYILIRGWVYGKAGSPLGAKVIGSNTSKEGLHASDHFGVKAELWDPYI